MKNFMLMFVVFASSLCGADALSHAQIRQSLTLISSEISPPTIVIGGKATLSEQFAAEELKTYLEKITGRSFTLNDDLKKPEGKYIAVGKNKLTDAVDLSGLNEEQYIIEARPDCLIIIGGRKPPLLGTYARNRGTLYGVYDVLEQFGVRWYRPEPWGEFVPRMDTITIPIGRTVSKPPSYEMRSTLGGGFTRYRKRTDQESAWASLWVSRHRLNWDTDNEPKYGGKAFFQFHHIYDYIVPPKKYFNDHPEYFALIKGKRKPLDLCFGNPELQKVFAENLIALAKSQPYLSSISVEPEDGRGGWCECPLCKAMADPNNLANYSNQVCAFNNIIARKVATAVPGLRLHWLAYSGHTSVPTTVKQLESNTIIMPCPINEWADYSRKLLDQASTQNRGFVEALRGWSALKPSCIMIYEYWGGYGWMGPQPIVRNIADRTRDFRQFKVKGIYNESSPSWGPQGLELYMTAKLLWNPDLDVEKELNLYYQNYYGPATAPMKAYHEALMDALEKHPYSVFSGGRGMHLVFTPQLVKRLGGYMARAQELTKGHLLYERRLNGVWAGYEFGRRVCRILQLKKKTGKRVEIASFPGRGYYLQSTEAEQAYDDLVQWVRSFYRGDAVFDQSPDSPYFWYVKEDILENAAFQYLDESTLLKDF